MDDPHFTEDDVIEERRVRRAPTRRRVVSRRGAGFGGPGFNPAIAVAAALLAAFILVLIFGYLL